MPSVPVLLGVADREEPRQYLAYMQSLWSEQQLVTQQSKASQAFTQVARDYESPVLMTHSLQRLTLPHAFNSAAQPLLLPPGSEKPKAAAKAKGGKGKKGAKKR